MMAEAATIAILATVLNYEALVPNEYDSIATAVSGAAALLVLGIMITNMLQLLDDEHSGDSLYQRCADWLKSRSFMARVREAGKAILVLLTVAAVALKSLAPATTSMHMCLWRATVMLLAPASLLQTTQLAECLIALVLALVGVILNAALAGMLFSAIRDVLLRVHAVSRSTEDFAGHTVILGWSAKTLLVIKQLCLANESLGGSRIVVLAENDPQDLEAALANANFPKLGTHVAFVQGSILNRADLSKTSCTKARSIIVLAEDHQSSEDSDAKILRVLMLLMLLLQHAGPSPHVVLELQDQANEHVMQVAGRERVEIISTHEVIGQIMIACTRQPMIGSALELIMSFDGPEFYIKSWPREYATPALTSFQDAVVVGVKLGDGQNSEVVLNPPDDYIISQGDQLIVLAEDDDAYAPSTTMPLSHMSHEQAVQRVNREPERIMFLNWRRDMHLMIAELDRRVASGSVLYIMATIPKEEQILLLKANGMDVMRLQNLQVQLRQGNPLRKRDLEAMRLEAFGTILILNDSSTQSVFENRDSRALSTQLLVHEIQQERKRMNQRMEENCMILSEIVDPLSKELAASINDSFQIAGNSIVSAALAQVSDQRPLNLVFDELLSYQGCELSIVPAHTLCPAGVKLCFWDLMAKARATGRIVVGWIRDEGVLSINPPHKKERVLWQPGDKIVMLVN
ncbi:uncharacterized protein MONBRDRAFT_33812 [Monosiga brevicollis MX1]|uniref:RCK N-terminal domain-containing protein n=1 Tax=Monosiga brevicollis TaxID=81824 RepID=A9V7P2_MONBE|nr:uncharacterized protein MONBRDRAFT_33812 [Monosiga brevicollis MX1]EDQ86339.1 predicted protein [Monosiga brevicollis MX1]|eukprot:XP_001748729.1 hypothetical protein [Monosiga brevicollis MX1]